MLNHITMLKRLEPPQGRTIDMVLDTDTYNEVDDQFALAYAALSPNLNLQAVYAAPYLNDRSTSPADGMERSYQEILHILSLLENCENPPQVFRGSQSFMSAADKPVASPAMDDLIARALARPDDDPLYVAAIGCPVNVSSAIVACPAILDKIVVVWLGGNARYWPHSREFNLYQDVHASRVLFDSGVPLVVLPCQGVVTHLATSVQELDHYLGDAGGLGQYLTEIVDAYTLTHQEITTVRSKVIWDVAVIAYLVNPQWVPTNLYHAPYLQDDCRLSFDDARHFMREAWTLDRDAIYSDLFQKLGTKRY
ncbi:MAG: nucleoside hydrolase [Eubacteriales bacterium]|nr:nucleoside hydrolase [Eubacteriales bacterium]